MGIRSTDDREETCKNCDLSRSVGYEQINCKRDGKWYPELHSCPWIRINGKRVYNANGMK